MVKLFPARAQLVLLALANIDGTSTGDEDQLKLINQNGWIVVVVQLRRDRSLSCITKYAAEQTQRQALNVNETEKLVALKANHLVKFESLARSNARFGHVQTHASQVASLNPQVVE